jgi:hemerythrin-like domain-containing protein
MNLEESVVLPKAIETFSLEDWSEVATSFAENKDPLQDGSTQNSEWFRQFYRRIVTLVPEPWGVGERR